jgi:hypothetical protein
MYSSGNLDFAISAVKWLSNRPAGIEIRSKALDADALRSPTRARCGCSPCWWWR